MGPELLIASTIASAAATGGSMIAGSRAASQSARASVRSGMLERQAAHRSAAAQEMAGFREREAADEVYAAQERAFQFEMQAIDRQRQLGEGELKLGELQNQAAEFRAGQLETQG